jgi:hypothetical protein
VLSIKAKETQLVRARSDAETAEQTVQKQQREIERLKRELARTARATAISPPNVGSEGFNMGLVEPGSLSPDSVHHTNGGYSRGSLTLGSRLESARPRSYVSSASEDKENNGLESPIRESGLGRRKFTPPVSSHGTASPNRVNLRLGSGSASGDDQQQSARPGDSGENWKRAAEVTSQLKARIEQMKVRKYVLRRVYLPGLYQLEINSRS